MFVKKFQASTIDEALSAVKADMGPDALILATEPKRRFPFGSTHFEVTAASPERTNKEEEEREVSEEELERIFPHRKKQRYTEAEEEGASIRRTDQARYADFMPEPASGRISQPYLEQFEAVGFSLDLAKSLNNRLVSDYRRSDMCNPAFRDKVIRRALVEGIRTLRPEILDTRKHWVLIGTSGSGKTSACVKLAIHAKRHNGVVSLASMDRRKILGAAELGAYARLMGTAFDIEPGKKGATTQFVDTPCLSTMPDVESLKNLKKMSVLLVLDSRMRLSEMREIVERAQAWNPVGIIFTRVNLCKQKGVMLELIRNGNLALLGISMSSSFEMPFKFLESSEFASLALNTRGNA